VRENLQGEGYEIHEAGSGGELFRLLNGVSPDLLLLDHKLPDTTGAEILEEVRKRFPETAVVMMTAYGTVESAVQAMKLGASDYLTKPVNNSELLVVVKKALDASRLRREVRRLRHERRLAHGDINVVAESRAMREIMDLLDRIIASPAASTILLEGESGTGKNLIAKAIHYNSLRAEQPFVTITCSAITETLLESELFGHERGAFTDAKSQKKGLLELADKGTAFLDEIGEMGPGLQAKMLRFMEDKVFKRVGGTQDIEVDVRIVAATNRDLEMRVREGSFREDLYYRLKVIPVHLPSLRQRREDIPILAQQWVDHFNVEFHKSSKGFSSQAMDVMMRYHWPGNVRELKNMVERIMILSSSEIMDVENLPKTVREGRPAEDFRGLVPVGEMTLEQMEKHAIGEALDRTGQNQVRAAKILGISRDTLRYRMKKFGFAEDDEPGGSAGL
jgi:DNA-binding NtrC family response regulator